MLLPDKLFYHHLGKYAF